MDVQTATAVITGIRIIIGIIVFIISRKQELETRQAQLFMQVYNWWNTKATAEQYGRICYSYEITSFDDWLKLTGYETGKVTDFNVYSDVQSMSNFFEVIDVASKLNQS